MPENAYCTNSKSEAWKCFDGFKEIGDACQKLYKNQTGNCIIKGNISFKSKEKKYHLPGSKYYDETIIDTKYGERYFCTELEATNAGWKIASSTEKIDDLNYTLSQPSQKHQNYTIDYTEEEYYQNGGSTYYEDDEESDYLDSYQDSY